MEFLNPAALYGFFALPLLLVPYLIKGRPRRLVFSSLLLLKDFSSSTHSRPWGRLRVPPIFFLQLLLLTLLILALGEPVFSVRPSSIAVVIDNSASMQALEGDRTRFAVALDEARGLVGDLGATARVDLYVTAPTLEKIGGESLSPSAALSALATLRVLDLGEPPGDYGEILSRLVREKNYDRMFVLTDHSARGRSAKIRIISVGRPKGNLALSAFQIARSSLVDARLEARAEVANFSDKHEAVKVSLKGGGKVLSSQSVAVAAGQSAVATFEGFPLHPYYEAEIAAADSLPLDNRRYVLSPSSQNLRILAISPRPQSLGSLRSIPGVSLEVIAPEAYEKSQRTGHTLELFHFSAPAELPQSHALFILPPDKNPWVTLKSPIARPVISGWREPHPLTRYVNFALFRTAYSRPLEPGIFGETVIESPQGALAIAGEHRGFRYMVLGFDPFPYLGRENLPISIFTLNFLDWFFHGPGGGHQFTGRPLLLAASKERGSLTTPKGEKISLETGTAQFSATWFQGIYELRRGNEKRLFAVNLLGPTESDLREPAAIELHDEGESESGPSVFFSFWPYLLLFCLLLVILEWLFNPPLAPARMAKASNETVRQR